MSFQQAVRLEDEFETLSSGLLLFRQPAVATPESINRFFDRAAQIPNGPRAGLIVDVRNWKGFDAIGRSVVYRRGAEVRRLRIAVVAATRLQRAMVTFAALATLTNVRCFETIEEASQWLKN